MSILSPCRAFLSGLCLGVSIGWFCAVVCVRPVLAAERQAARRVCDALRRLVGGVGDE